MINYDPHHWSSHFFDIRGSMVREIIGRVGICVLWSAGVTAFHIYVHPLGVPSTVHSLVGVALGLLLVFRTNSSYDRFWEGRKLWGSIVNECRNLARGARVLLKHDPQLMREVVRWTAAFPYSAMHGLRDRDGLGQAAALLPETEVASALAANHTPLEVATRITSLLAEARDRGKISDYVLMSLDENVQLLIDYIGGCERIHRTPIPFAYMVHLRRALMLYCFTLPFALVKEFGWGTVLDTFLVTYVFFGIEEIGVEIEDPFGEDANDLPLDDICRMIERNVMSLVGDDGTGEVRAGA
jgi:putative membrane protein